MTKEELMTPRIMCIGTGKFHYPNSQFEVGEILYQSGDCFGSLAKYGSGAMMRSVYKPENYPHLFKQLEWWEERKDVDTPEYLKRPKNGIIFKPYHIDIETGLYYENEKEYMNNDYSQLSDVEPGDESEYSAYMKSKNGNTKIQQ